MKKLLILSLFVFVFSGIALQLVAQSGRMNPEMKKYVDLLSNIDPEMRKYFPRWKICEPDLQFQVYKTFKLAGFPPNRLNLQDIEVLAAPRLYKEDPFEILVISCGDTSMNSRQLDNEMPRLIEYISGEIAFRNASIAEMGERDYCFVEIPPEVPVNNTQAQAIQDFFKPTNVEQAITLSLFEQSLKVGDTGFWLISKMGTDEVGYSYWNAGEAKVMLKRPLYTNLDMKTNGKIPYLINAYLGAGYRINAGLGDGNSILNWLPNRQLNSTPGGKLIAGFDVHMPFKPEAGIHLNLEMPFQNIEDEGIEIRNYAKYDRLNGNQPDFLPTDGRFGQRYEGIVPVLQTTGQLTAFYNLWLDGKGASENFFRFDLGVSYAEIQEFLAYNLNDDPNVEGNNIQLAKNNVEGLRLHRNSEFADWIYAKVEYRNQSVYPFSVSMQYSNQTFLASGFLPLFGNWLFLEAKYVTLLRDARQFEIDNFFIISPVLRITI